MWAAMQVATMPADYQQIDDRKNFGGPKQKRRLGTASNEITGGLQLICGRPTLALSSALVPQTPTFSSRGPYNSRAYKRLSSEFWVSPDTDWRQKLDHGCQGLESWSTFMTPCGAYRRAQTAQGPFFHPKDASRHICDIPGAWTSFVLDRSEGFMQAGVERVNDSMRHCAWAILGVKAQTRSNILKTDSQKQFLANIGDAIASPVDIPSGIAKYQKLLQYASTPLDYICGTWFYLMPRNMALHLGNVQEYNNLIQIPGSDVVIGHNPGINEVEPINPTFEVDKAFQGKNAPPAGTDHKGPQPSPETNGGGKSAAGVPEERQSAGQATAHEEGKNGPRGRWNSSRPSGALAVISLASPEQQRETGSPQQ